MLRNVNDIHILSYDKLFSKYDVTETDIRKYRKLLAEDKEEEVIDHFVENYILPPIDVYYKHTNEYLIEAEKGELSEKNKSNLLKMIALSTFSLLTLLNTNFSEFMKKAVGYNIFIKRNITKQKVKDAILDATLGQFESLTTEALMGTQARLLKNIRSIQREFIFFNQTTKGFSGSELAVRTNAFLRTLTNRLPEYEKLKEGKFIRSRSFGIDDKVRNYKLNNYFEMSARTTLLNIDRTAVQISVLNKEAEKATKKGRYAVNVVSYAKIDNRKLKTGIEREICKQVLSERKYGIPLLALDTKTAEILGIRTVDEIRSTPDYAMGPWCRHGLRPLSVRMNKKLEKIIKEYYEGV